MIKKLLAKLLNRKPAQPEDPYEPGFCNGHGARRHRTNGQVEFVLWKAGQHGHAEDFWIRMDPSWWPTFIPADSTTQQETVGSQGQASCAP